MSSLRKFHIRQQKERKKSRHANRRGDPVGGRDAPVINMKPVNWLLLKYDTKFTILHCYGSACHQISGSGCRMRSHPPPKNAPSIMWSSIYSRTSLIRPRDPYGHKMWSVKDRWSLMAAQQKDQNLTFLDHVDTSRFFHFGECILEWMLLSHYHNY